MGCRAKETDYGGPAILLRPVDWFYPPPGCAVLPLFAGANRGRETVFSSTLSLPAVYGEDRDW